MIKSLDGGEGSSFPCARSARKAGVTPTQRSRLQLCGSVARRDSYHSATRTGLAGAAYQLWGRVMGWRAGMGRAGGPTAGAGHAVRGGGMWE